MVATVGAGGLCRLDPSWISQHMDIGEPGDLRTILIWKKNCCVGLCDTRFCSFLEYISLHSSQERQPWHEKHATGLHRDTSGNIVVKIVFGLVLSCVCVRLSSGRVYGTCKRMMHRFEIRREPDAEGGPVPLYPSRTRQYDGCERLALK